MLWCNNYTHTPIVQWCLEDVLGMTDYYLNVNSCVFLNCKGGEFIPPDKVYISQDLKHPADLQAIFHEVRHYYQFKREMFDFKLSALEKNLAYQNYPWEIDANQFSIQTFTKFLNTPMGKPHP